MVYLKRAVCTGLLLVLAAHFFGCPSTDERREARRNAPASSATPAESGTPSADETRLEKSEEERETEQDLRMRARVREQLGAYRAPSCAAAIAKIEGLLRQGKGRWQERTETGALPADLVGILTQAQLFGSQSAAVCKDDPARPKFEALRALMDVIWVYPTKISRAQLDERLGVLGE